MRDLEQKNHPPNLTGVQCKEMISICDSEKSMFIEVLWFPECPILEHHRI